ncbi:MAG: hypothetical protein ACR2GK_05285 [Gemmatimonadaceae bacterium]
MPRIALLAAVLSLAPLQLGCVDQATSTLPPALEQRFEAEGIARRAADQTFRFTSDPGGRSERREDRRASIIVTKSSVYIHKNDKAGLELTPRMRRASSVSRSGDRVLIRSGSGASEVIWSFVPPEDAPGWTTDIRAVIRQGGK